MIMTIAMAAASLFASCKDDVEMRYPPKYELPELPVVEGIHDNKRAPLYWSVYEYCYEQERAGVANENMDLTPAQWDDAPRRPTGCRNSTSAPPAFASAQETR